MIRSCWIAAVGLETGPIAAAGRKLRYGLGKENSYQRMYNQLRVRKRYGAAVRALGCFDRPVKAMRKIFSSGSVWEDKAGYSRAVQVGPILEVSGTTALDEGGNVVGKGDAFVQTKYILKKIQRTMNEAGFRMADVIRTRMYVCDMSVSEEVSRAHALFFRDIKPASTLVQVSRLIDPDLIIEIELSAYVSK